MRLSQYRLRRCALALFAAATLVAPSLDARSRPPPEPPPPPPPPPEAPAKPVGMPPAALRDASAYLSYIRRADALKAQFAGPQDVSALLAAASDFDPEELARGAEAYAAFAALQEPAFVNAVRGSATTDRNRRTLVAFLLANAGYATVFDGSAAAAARARAAIGPEALKLYDAGMQVQTAAYTIQHQSWSKTDVADRPGRLATIKAMETHVHADPGANLNISDPPALAMSQPYPALVQRALQLAALAASGEADDQAYAQFIQKGTAAGDCLHRVRINLYQCLAVARPQYEDMYCAGRYPMSDVGVCLAPAVGEIIPAPPPPPAKAVAARKTRRRRRA
jgi:hypothetical protein